ncbi:glycine-rich domain-containing protein [Actinomadura gamaensis]|uniref:Glycine-rich domain-containing protein n=1 Tax=Actinomadura gamaensis TaxID=1763541 RepID=A0ABV9TNV5_9ACTN
MTTITEPVSDPAFDGPDGLLPADLFARLVARISRDEEVSIDYAERVMSQTLGFLQACALNPAAGLSPSEAVDVGWHAFILHTREYAAYCQRLAGRFIHHRPSDDFDEAASRKSEAIGATVAAMRAAGIGVDPELWLPASRCSQCYAGCADDPRTGETA